MSTGRELVLVRTAMASTDNLAGRVIVPTAFAFLLFAVALWLAARGAPARGPASRPPRSAPEWLALTRLLLTMAGVGYLAFLALVLVFYLGLGGQGPGFLRDALGGGAFLAFGVAVPGFLFAELVRGAVGGRRSRRG